MTEDFSTGPCTPADSADLIDFERMKVGHCEDGEVISYTFDVTALLDAVNKGDTIALAGSSGNAAKAKLHFELRHNGTAYNPRNYFK